MNEGMDLVSSRSGNSSASSDQTQEDLWVASSREGDTLAFNRLVLKWEMTVYNMALRMLRDQEEALEATQEIFLLAFKNIRRFRQNCKFSTWLYRITLNHCISRAKQRPRGAYLSLDDESVSDSAGGQLQIPQTQVGELIRKERKNRVLEALLYLPPEQRAVVELKFFQEMTFEDIAAVLETPMSTIKSRLYAGLELLKIRLGHKV
jgi:RNA polymerase sigma-70 factor (ECF subfamily)